MSVEAPLNSLSVGTIFRRPKGRARYLVVDPKDVEAALSGKLDYFVVDRDGNLQFDQSQLSSRVALAIGNDTLSLSEILQRLGENVQPFKGTQLLRSVFPDSIRQWRASGMKSEEVLSRLWTVNLSDGKLCTPRHKHRGSVLILNPPRATLLETLMRDD